MLTLHSTPRLFQNHFNTKIIVKLLLEINNNELWPQHQLQFVLSYIGRFRVVAKDFVNTLLGH